MVWRLLADLVAGVHYAFLLYLIVGGFLAWRWQRTIWLHLVTAVWGALIVTTKVPCPLTWLQNSFRSLGGEPHLRTGFIQAYVRGTFYPLSQEGLSQVVVGVVVLASWIGYAWLLRRRQRGHRRPDNSPAPEQRSSVTPH